MNTIKKYQFWICAIFSVFFFVAIYPLSVDPYTGAYYVLVFNAISITVLASVLYCALMKSFTKKRISKLIWILAISSLPHILFLILSYGSWICLGCSIIIIIALLCMNNKMAE